MIILTNTHHVCSSRLKLYMYTQNVCETVFCIMVEMVLIIIINKDFSISSSYMLILVIKLYEGGGGLFFPSLPQLW